MTIEAKIQAFLVATAAITALVPRDRIKVEGLIEKLATPYIVHGPSGVEPTHSHSGVEAITPYRSYAVACFGSGPAAQGQARAVALAVRDALASYAGTGFTSMWVDEGPYDVDDEKGVVGYSVYFDVWDYLT